MSGDFRDAESAQERATAVAGRVARELAEGGSLAVVIVGSLARGDASPESDVDLLAVGPASYMPRLEVREGLLVGVSSQPLDTHRESFRQPEMVGEAVPGWRDALVLHDPDGLAASLIGEARAWSWKPSERSCDRWVAEEVTARAETVHKLVGALRGGRLPTASVKRHLLATRLAHALAVHRRILHGSESRLWELLAGEMGETWGEAQHAALGQADESLADSCAAALRMYSLAADETEHLLDERQGRVVRKACDLAGLPLP